MSGGWSPQQDLLEAMAEPAMMPLKTMPTEESPRTRGFLQLGPWMIRGEFGGGLCLLFRFYLGSIEMIGNATFFLKFKMFNRQVG